LSSLPWSVLSVRLRSGLFLGRMGSEFAQRVNSRFIQDYKRESCVAVEKWDSFLVTSPTAHASSKSSHNLNYPYRPRTVTDHVSFRYIPVRAVI
jgi:hypothetical protein